MNMPSNISLLITGSPTSSQAHLSALRYLQAALKADCTISSVFFYQDAVTVASQFNSQPSDEYQIQEKWLAVAKKHNFELQVCVAAANRRGVIQPELEHNESFQEQTLSSSLKVGFSLTGLGQLAATMANFDLKLIHFK